MRRSGVFGAMNAPGGPRGASRSLWLLKGNSVGRYGGESRGLRTAELRDKYGVPGIFVVKELEPFVGGRPTTGWGNPARAGRSA